MSEFKRVGLLGRREHPGVSQVVAHLLDLLDSRGIDVVLEDRLATLAHFETRAMQPRDAIGANVDLAIVIGGDGSLLSAARTLVRHDCPVKAITPSRQKKRVVFFTRGSIELEVTRYVFHVLYP